MTTAPSFAKLARRWAAALVSAVFACGAVQAADPVNGATLYANNCAGCHGGSPLTSNGSKIYNGRNAMSVIDSGINGVGEMRSLRGAYPSGGSALADVAAYLGNSPSTLSFGSAAVGSASAAMTVTVRSSNSASLSGVSVSLSGDFSRSGGTCAASLAAGTSCSIAVTFSPTTLGARSGTLSIAHAGTPTPVAIALSGSGSGNAAAVASVAPASLAFASTMLGSTSAAQNVTLSNSGNAVLTLGSIASDSADFVIAGGTCAAGAMVAAGSNCIVSVAFKPSAVGARAGTLNIAHNAAGGSLAVALSGIGAAAAAAPTATLSATSLSFGSIIVGASSNAQSVTLSNSGNAPLVLGTVTAGGDFALGNGTCVAAASIAAQSSCTASILFTPAMAGARSGTLTITHNAAGGSSAVSLAGTGVAATPSIALSPASLAFSQTVGTTSVAQTVTISNAGTAALVISGITIGGAQASEFAQTAGTTCAAGGSVAPSASCVMRLSFTPAATGARSATLAITHNAPGSPSAVALNGTGTATPQPAISVDQSSLVFVSQAIGTTSAGQTVVVTNSGAATLTFSGIALTGSNAADFARSGTCQPSGSLVAGATCTVVLSFTPGAIGARSATLTIASNASNGSAAVSVSGTGAAAAVPAVSLTPASLDFGSQAIGVASSSRTLTLANVGSGPLAIGSIAAAAPFGLTHNCPASLAAATSCSINVVFTPSASGAVSGSVNVSSNATGSPHMAALAGSGAAAVPALLWSPATTALDLGSAAVGSVAPIRPLVLMNQGPGAVSLQQLTIAGAQASEFSLATGSTCTAGLSLAQNATCTVLVGFQPAAAGTRGASLQVSSNGSDPPSVALSGTGSAMVQPTLGVAPAAISITAAPLPAVPDPQLLTVQSVGSAALQVSQIRVATGSFTIAPAATNPCPSAAFALMPGHNCGVMVAWSGGAAQTETGAVEIVSDATAAPLRVDIQAERAAALPTVQNVGSGGCTIARGGSSADPVLWLLVALACAVLWWRRSRR